jgi:hypothetical protein
VHNGRNTQAIVQAIDEWLMTVPPAAFRKRALEIPPDDEYGFATLVAIEPVRSDACPIEIGVTVPDAGSTVGMFLDTWGGLARRLPCEVSPGKATRISLFVEPSPLSIEQVRDACSAVVAGSIHLDAGLVRQKLVSTSGWLDTRAGRFTMHGVDGYLLPFLRTMTRVGITEVRTVRYAPWV